MKIFISCFIVALLTSSSSFAAKERGGGNVGTNGSLSELQMDIGATELSRQDLDGYLKVYSDLVATGLPLVQAVLLDTQHDYFSRWLIEVKPLHTTGCTMTGQITVACQVVDTQTGKSVIRISGAYWKKATAKQRSQLVLHERLRNYMFLRGYQCNNCLFAAVQAFDADPSDVDIYLHNLSQTLFNQGFGVYLQDETKKLVIIAAHTRLQAACADAPEKFQADAKAALAQTEAGAGFPTGLADRSLQDVLTYDASLTQADCAHLDQLNAIEIDSEETAAIQ